MTMRQDSRKSFRKPGSDEGFAVVIALTLMGFVLVLLLGLSSFVAVETSVSESTRQKTKAQANAMLGMQIALAQLQETMGPDQRVSANASIRDPDVAVDSNKRHLVGVWDSSGWDYRNPQQKGNFLGWLISNRAPDGSFERPTNLDFISNAASSDVLLVGESSVGADPDDWIWADTIEVADSLADEAYAFWVADEGQKSRADLARDEDFALQPAPERQRQFESSPQTELGILSDFNALPDGEQESLQNGNLLSFDQLPLLDPSGSLGPGFHRNLFHDVTFSSKGLLTNVRTGGLKEDLNLLFEQEDDDFFAGDYGANAPNNLKMRDGSRSLIRKEHRSLYILDSFPGLSGTGGLFLIGPSFATLRDNYRVYKTVENSRIGDFTVPSQRVEPFLAELKNFFAADYSFRVQGGQASRFNEDPNYWLGRARSVRLAPTVLRYQMLFSFKSEPYSGTWRINGDSGPEPATHQMTLIVSPILVLWNPYDVAIEFQGMTIQQANAIPMRFDWDVLYGSNREQSNNNDFTSMIESGSIFWTEGPKFSFSSDFELARLEPGEVKVFSLADPNIQDFNTNSQGFDLGPGFRSSGGFRVKKLLSNEKIEYVDTDGTVETGPSRLLLNSNTNFALNAETRINDNWRSQFFIDSYLVHEGSYGQRFEVGHSADGDHASPMQSAAIITTRNSILQDVGNIGRIPEDTTGYFDESVWSDRRDFGVLDMQARPADFPAKPAKIFGPHNPTAWTLTTPWVHNQFNDETMLGAYTLIASPLPNGQFQVIDHDFASSRAFWGQSYSNFSGESFVSIYQIPKMPMWSLGALQHASGMATFAFEPSHIVGSSFASPLIPKDSFVTALNCPIDGNVPPMVIGDTSYLTNVALWDQYFFSSIAPQNSSAFSNKLDLVEVLDAIPDEGLPNSRIRLEGEFADLRDSVLDASGAELDVQAYGNVAKYLSVDGAFNINSTSVEAWKGVLAGMRRKAIEYFNPTGGGALTYNPNGTVIPRSTIPPGPEGNLWRGFRDLTDEQIDNLATEIVQQVKLRGPFMNLANFVNRNLSNGDLGSAGALQAAIGLADLNSGYEGAFIGEANVSGFPNSDAASGDAATSASAYFTQGDILQAIAPIISARSDTFKIRAYGRVGGRIDNSDEAVEAWCEAVVQRKIDYVDEGSTSALAPEDLPDPGSVGDKFGRKFEIVSFRWLSESEI